MRISTINKKVRRVCTNLVSVGCCDSSNQLIIISPLGKFSTFRLFAGMEARTFKILVIGQLPIGNGGLKL